MTFKLTNTPNDASDSFIAKLHGDEFESLVPELMFRTKKRHRPDIYECQNCNYQFPQEARCPECNSTNLRLFMRAPSRNELRNSIDRESELDELDPEWRERFCGDEDRAWEFYHPIRQGRPIGGGHFEPPEYAPYREPDDVDGDDLRED